MMTTLTDSFEDLPLGKPVTKIDRQHFTLEVPSKTGTKLEAVRDPLTEIKKGVWVQYKWGSHFGESDYMTITLKNDSVRSVSFINYRFVAGDPCRYFDAAGRLLGTAELPDRSSDPVVYASSTTPIKTIEVSVAGGPGAFIAFDDVVIELA